MNMIKDTDLIEYSKLLKQKRRLLGTGPSAIREKHNIKVMRKLIDRIANGNIHNSLNQLKEQLEVIKNETNKTD